MFVNARARVYRVLEAHKKLKGGGDTQKKLDGAGSWQTKGLASY